MRASQTIWQKSLAHLAKETYLNIKRDLSKCQKRPIYAPKETHTYCMPTFENACQPRRLARRQQVLQCHRVHPLLPPAYHRRPIRRVCVTSCVCVCVCVCVCACVCVSHGPMHICGQAPHTQSRACTHTQPHARSLPRSLSRSVAVSHCCSLLPPSICSHPNALAGHHKTRRTPQGINVRCSTKHTTLGSTKYIARNTTKSTRGWTRLLDTSLPQRPAYNAEEASTE